MKFSVITIFPKIFDSYFSESIIKRALREKLVEIKVHDLRGFTNDKHRTIDDTPYGGGPGMVMKVEPIHRAVQSIKNIANARKKTKTSSTDAASKATRTVLFSAKGKKFTQKDAKRMLKYENIIMICGRYEGVDDRVAQNIADEEISIGDYVLTGGEIPAMAVIDSVTRLIPGVLGNKESIKEESHSKDGYLEYPHYTKPEDFMGWRVPKILLGGNHKKIKEWKKSKSK